MHTKRLAALLLGAWLAGSLFMTAGAIGSLGAANRILKSPDLPIRQLLDPLPDDSARMLLHYVASEFNRSYFSGWELTQLALGTAVLASFGASRNRVILTLSGFLLLLVILQHWLLTPRMNEASRAIDFIREDAISVERAIFLRYHSAYSAFEVIKVAIMMGLSVNLLYYRSHRRKRGGKQVNAIHDADNG